MVCSRCGAENEEWAQYCYQCNARLKPVQLSKVTRVTTILSIIEGLGVALLMGQNGFRKFSSMAIGNKALFLGILVCLIIASVSEVIFLHSKKKIGILVADALWLAFLSCNVVLGGSPIFSAVLLLPAAGATVSIISNWKDM